jgi:hypothetical protein
MNLLHQDQHQNGRLVSFEFPLPKVSSTQCLGQCPVPAHRNLELSLYLRQLDQELLRPQNQALHPHRLELAPSRSGQ